MVLGGEVLNDWPGPPTDACDWERLRAYVETRFLAELLHSDIEFYIGPGNKLQSTWNRAVRLQKKLEWERRSRKHEHLTRGAATPREDQAGEC